MQVGTRADLVTLDRNVFDLPADEIGSAEVTSTWAAGSLVHHRRA